MTVNVFGVLKNEKQTVFSFIIITFAADLFKSGIIQPIGWMPIGFLSKVPVKVV
uniref:hypothetical protein n=1 Tax=Prevotella sp. TaxID=59823 RepID=UPI0040281D86